MKQITNVTIQSPYEQPYEIEQPNYEYKQQGNSHKSSFITLDNSMHKVQTTTTTALESFHKICEFISLLECILLVVQSFLSVVSLCINETFWWTQVMSSLSFVIVLYSVVLLILLQLYENFDVKIQKLNKFYEKCNKKEIRFISYIILNQLTSICINHVNKQLQLTSLSFYVINMSINILMLIDLLLQRKQDKLRQLRGVQQIDNAENISSISQNNQNITAESV